MGGKLWALPMPDSEKRRVLVANAAFYAAFRAGDLRAMESIWSRRRAVCVFHPNARGIEGREAVMRSWEAILVDGGPCEIVPVKPLVIMSRNSAMVICEERVGDTRMIATNLFAREPGGWFMVHHQATRLPATAGKAARTQGSKGRRGR